MKRVIAYCVAFYIFAGYFSSILANSVLIQYIAIGVSILLSIFLVKHKNIKFVGSLLLMSLISIIIIKYYTIEPMGGNYDDYIEAKPFRIGSLLLYSFSLALIFKGDLEILDSFIRACYVFLIFVFIISLFEGSFSSSSRFVIGEGGNPIWTARAFGLLAIISYFRAKNRLLKIILISVSLIGIFLTRSEGPLFSLFVVMFIEFQNSGIKNKKVKHLITGLFFAVGGSILFFFINNVDFNGREILYENALKYIKSNPFGNGIGYFALFNSLPYPHNILLEIGLEFGIIILIVFLIMNYHVIKKYVFNIKKYDPIVQIIFYVYIFDLINAQFSGDITSPKILYINMFILLFLGVGRRVKYSYLNAATK